MLAKGLILDEATVLLPVRFLMSQCVFMPFYINHATVCLLKARNSLPLTISGLIVCNRDALMPKLRVVSRSKKILAIIFGLVAVLVVAINIQAWR
jgi:hypothetical protein